MFPFSMFYLNKFVYLYHKSAFVRNLTGPRLAEAAFILALITNTDYQYSISNTNASRDAFSQINKYKQ